MYLRISKLSHPELPGCVTVTGSPYLGTFMGAVHLTHILHPCSSHVILVGLTQVGGGKMLFPCNSDSIYLFPH